VPLPMMISSCLRYWFSLSTGLMSPRSTLLGLSHLAPVAVDTSQAD
jgi:hypothetical protein